MKIINHSAGQIDFPDSRWKLVIERDGEQVVFSLYWADKQLPTHQTTCKLEDYDKMAEALGLTGD